MSNEILDFKISPNFHLAPGKQEMAENHILSIYLRALVSFHVAGKTRTVSVPRFDRTWTDVILVDIILIILDAVISVIILVIIILIIVSNESCKSGVRVANKNEVL